MSSGTDTPARHRTIRSFVRRAGRLTTSQQRALEELWPDFGVEFSADLLNFETLFKRRAPVVLEIGFGNGDTLVQQAAEHPEFDFIGIEVHEPGIGHCLIKARDAGTGNLRLIRHDAVEVLEAMIPPASLARVNLYFPDPWPKKRHHPRRLIQPGFVRVLARRLVAGGELHVATDHIGYAEWIDEVLAGEPSLENACAPERFRRSVSNRPATAYELEWRAQGHPFCFFSYRRRADAVSCGPGPG